MGGCKGCDGGFPTTAYKYLEKNYLEETRDYRYKARKSHCRANKDKGKVKVTKYHSVKKNNPDEMKKAVANGPVSVLVDASSKQF